MKKIIVTGANGFIGSSLIKKMLANNVEVVAVDITFAGDRLPVSNLITKVESGVEAALAEKIPAGEYDAFYHLAWKGVNGAEKADPSVQIANIQMAVDCANICKQYSVKYQKPPPPFVRGYNLLKKFFPRDTVLLKFVFPL